jgi:hypothetical protein
MTMGAVEFSAAPFFCVFGLVFATARNLVTPVRFRETIFFSVYFPKSRA